MRFTLGRISALAFTLGCLLAGLPAVASDLKPFSTDGCSLWIDGTPERPHLWRHCCVAHDFAYWKGGSRAERKQADEAILACVKQAQGPAMATHMYTNVRWGGSPYWPSHYRWGYGWSYWEGFRPRGYKLPSAEEQKRIAQALPAAQALIAADACLHPANATAAPVTQTSLTSTQMTAKQPEPACPITP